jgi:predicted RNA-binding Zn-ribbon protein involved in translation (DUF1610 family)
VLVHRSTTCEIIIPAKRVALFKTPSCIKQRITSVSDSRTIAEQSRENSHSRMTKEQSRDNSHARIRGKAALEGRGRNPIMPGFSPGLCFSMPLTWSRTYCGSPFPATRTRSVTGASFCPPLCPSHVRFCQVSLCAADGVTVNWMAYQS